MNIIHKSTIKNISKFSNIISNEIQEFANLSINERGVFNIVLCGGRSPKEIYEKLKSIETRWECWHFWLADERLFSNDSNFNLVEKVLLNHIPYNKNQLHLFDTGIDFKKSLSIYNNSLNNIILFDLCLLGVGEDGHIASLFPNLIWDYNQMHAFLLYNSPKKPSVRITLSLKRLNLSRKIILIARGVEKYHLLSKTNLDLTLPFNSIKAIDSTKFYYCKE
jgi:6-phosphogluconolactonase